MSSTIDYLDCPYCHSKGTFVSDFYYRTDEEYCFCTNCGSHYNVTLNRDSSGKPVFNTPKHYDFGKIEIKAEIENNTVAVATIDNKAMFDCYNNHIAEPKAFAECFPAFCNEIDNYILARPEKFAREIENYKRGCYHDGSGDKYAVAPWRRASLRILYENESFLYFNTKIEFDDTGMLVSECDYVTDEKICCGTFTVSDGKAVSAFHSFETMPSEEQLKALVNDPNVKNIKIVKDGNVEIIKNTQEFSCNSESSETLPF